MQKTSVEAYLSEGCGRCELYRTPACKVHRWTDALKALRGVLLEAGLEETLKWGAPCYTSRGKNIALFAAFKDWCSLSFFRGHALEDDTGLLERPGPNSRVARVAKFRGVDEVLAARHQLVRLVRAAIALEEGAPTSRPQKEVEPLPAELEASLQAAPDVAKAFEALTPGRQRSHILYISGAKREDTRQRRVERCVPLILAGLGSDER